MRKRGGVLPRSRRPARSVRVPTRYLARPAAAWARALRDRDPLVRRLAAHALAEIGRAAPRSAATALGRALDDEKSFVRVWAAAALARVDPQDPRVVPALVAAMRDATAFVRSLGAWHLGRFGVGLANVEPALPVLEALAADPDPSVRIEAALALKTLRGAAARAPSR